MVFHKTNEPPRRGVEERGAGDGAGKGALGSSCKGQQRGDLVITDLGIPIPAPGEIVRVRQRQYLVEEVLAATPGEATLVSMSCLDDDEPGEPLEVLWEHEIDAQIVSASWDQLGRRGFDAASRFAAYLHTLRWNCVTATNPRLFQSPWRAGIEVMAYQLEPLRKALRYSGPQKLDKAIS
jgi:hypothetical protein